MIPDATSNPDAPYALADPDEQARRHQLLHARHMRPLENYRTLLSEALGASDAVPYFDPCDGGASARALFLLEAPGRKALGSGFISRNNPDPTARNMCNLLAEARIPREHTVLWNVVPWYVGSHEKIRPVRQTDLESALPHLGDLIAILTNLRCIVLVGRKAQNARKHIAARTRAQILECYHPSNVCLNRDRSRRRQILEVFKLARTIIR